MVVAVNDENSSVLINVFSLEFCFRQRQQDQNAFNNSQRGVIIVHPI